MKPRSHMQVYSAEMLLFNAIAQVAQVSTVGQYGLLQHGLGCFSHLRDTRDYWREIVVGPREPTEALPPNTNAEPC